MKNSSCDIERKVLGALQGGFPVSPTPYSDMARQVGISAQALLEILRTWRQEGKLRRVGAIVNHFKVGMGAGAMVAWEVAPEKIEKVGEIFAGFEQVSHAYERAAAAHWPYNIYTMVHGSSDEQVEATVGRMSQLAQVSRYRILRTERELKKVAPAYVKEPEK